MANSRKDDRWAVLDAAPGYSQPPRPAKAPKASKLYSTPRKFDLAMILVVTAAYGLLFAIVRFLFPSEPTLIFWVGAFITSVGLAQAIFETHANPRGVSILVGALLSIILIVYVFYEEGAASGVWGSFCVIPFFGFLGYLAGAMIGGVFLLADMMRQRLENRRYKRRPKKTLPAAPEHPLD